MSDDVPERIVSLAPSVTETIYELGLENKIVGRTTHCPNPNDGNVIGGWLNPDYEMVQGLNPDVVFTSDGLQDGVSEELQSLECRTCHLEPETLGDVIESFYTVGSVLGVPERGHNLAWDCRGRIQDVKEKVSGCEPPTVYSEEWSDPPMAAGNWVPDMIRSAGGEYPFVNAGERSSEVTRADVESENPEYAVLHVCGFGEKTSPDVILDRGWDIDAVMKENVIVLDDSLMNQSSPNLVTGIEKLAEAFHGI